MLRPLLYLFAVIVLPGAAGLEFNSSSEFNISLCPITYFGQKYERLYVNFTNKHFVVCFNGFYHPETKGDCLLGPKAHSAEFNIKQIDEEFYRHYYDEQTHLDVSTITISTECYVQVHYHYKVNMTWSLASFGSQAVLKHSFYTFTGSEVTDVLVNGNKITRVNISAPSTIRNVSEYTDLSGCRLSGFGYKAGVSYDPKTCTAVVCNDTAVQQTSTCGPLERCQGNGSCSTMLNSVCTVTGPTVIDFHSQVNSVEDRCSYSLLSIPSVPGLQVLADFQERRRKDVSFLDSVTLRLDEPGVQIHLKQGGRVLLGDSTLTLNSSAQLVHGVELSKDQTGVTAKVLLSNFTTSVFFDGYTAQILVEGPAGSSLLGLCGNASRSLSEERVSESSSPSCETQYTDTSDRTINCTQITERCNLLKESPFSSCDIDPQPYITACTDVLCKYPDLDGLKCQFLEAYARACSLRSNATLEGWRSKAACSPPEAFCQNQTCSDQEFCGETTVGGETRCFCRQIFASKYRHRNALGDPTVCSQNSASLTLVGCLLEDKGIDYSVLHLNDPTCRGLMDKETHMVTFSINSSSCGTEILTNNSQIIYKNSIRTQDSSDIITRRYQVHIDFSCVQAQPDIKTVAFRIRDSSVLQVITSGPWRYTLTMKAYTDASRTRRVELSTEVRLNQKIWVELDTDGLDGDRVAVVTKSCWATDQASPNSSPRYDLIQNGCANAADRTVKVERNGEGTSSYFSFNMFQFSGGSGEIYLHCSVQLCVKQGDSCIQTCDGARRRRSAGSRYEAAAFINMVWTT